MGKAMRTNENAAPDPWYTRFYVVVGLALMLIGGVAGLAMVVPEPPVLPFYVGEVVTVDSNVVVTHIQRQVAHGLKLTIQDKDTTAAMFRRTSRFWDSAQVSIVSISGDSVLVETAHGNVVVPLRVLKRIPPDVKNC